MFFLVRGCEGLRHTSTNKGTAGGRLLLPYCCCCKNISSASIKDSEADQRRTHAAPSVAHVLCIMYIQYLPSISLVAQWNLLSSSREKRGKNYVIINIISAHKSDLSNLWSQTQASLSIPSLHEKKKKREREEKNNRRASLPRSDRRGGEKIKQEQKNKSKDPPRISGRQINTQARQTKCQDHSTVDTVRESLSTPHQSLGGGSGQSSVETKEHQYSNAKNHPLLFCGIQRHHGSSNGKVAKSSFAWRALVSFTRLVDQADMNNSIFFLL